MGQAKQLLPIHGEAMLLQTARPFFEARTAGVVVVTTSAIAEQIDWPVGIEVRLNDEPGTEMIDSIRLGLRHWQDRAAPAEQGGFLVCPGDQPGLRVDDINACIAAYEADPARIVVATHHGRRGHPIIVGQRYWDDIFSDICDQGLRNLLKTHAPAIVEVACAAPATLSNINTPEDYHQRADPGS